MTINWMIPPPYKITQPCLLIGVRASAWLLAVLGCLGCLAALLLARVVVADEVFFTVNADDLDKRCAGYEALEISRQFYGSIK